jgi:hypothetical protein
MWTISGAWLNHTTKLMKKATHERCSVLIFESLKSMRLMLAAAMLKQLPDSDGEPLHQEGPHGSSTPTGRATDVPICGRSDREQTRKIVPNAARM